jgi:hypothetical protein
MPMYVTQNDGLQLCCVPRQASAFLPVKVLLIVRRLLHSVIDGQDHRWVHDDWRLNASWCRSEV